jgi:hypothetical protein
VSRIVRETAPTFSAKQMLTLLRMLLLVIVGTAPFVLLAQDKPNLAGDFRGSLGPFRLKLHLITKPDGSLSGSLDSLDQGAMGIPCSDFEYDGKALSFAVPSVRGSWKGSVSNDARTLDGTWNQISRTSLQFTRATFVPAMKPSRVDGIWLGSVRENGRDLRGQLILKTDVISFRVIGTSARRTRWARLLRASKTGGN